MVQCAGRNPPKPCRTFEEGSFPDYILAVVEKEYGLQVPSYPASKRKGNNLNGFEDFHPEAKARMWP